jgi:hypothetical protein
MRHAGVGRALKFHRSCAGMPGSTSPSSARTCTATCPTSTGR